MSYFRELGTQWIKLDTGETVLLTDITKFATFVSKWKNDERLFLQYNIKDEERVDQISYHIYDTVDYWWTILLFNNIYDFDEQWPRSEKMLLRYIEEKYPFNNLGDIHHYETVDGVYMDLRALRLEYNINNDNDLISIFGLIPITIYDHEYILNESKRAIKIVDPDYIGQVISQFTELMNK